jgi:hypothetical protein
MSQQITNDTTEQSKGNRNGPKTVLSIDSSEIENTNETFSTHSTFSSDDAIFYQKTSIEHRERNEEDEMMIINASKPSNRKKDLNRRSNKPKKKIKYKTHTIALKNSESVSDVRGLTKDVVFRFNVLKPRIAPSTEIKRSDIDYKTESESSRSTTTNIDLGSANPESTISNINSVLNGKENDDNDRKRDRSLVSITNKKPKTLLEMTFEQVDKFYSEGFEIEKTQINEEASERNFSELDSVPVSFVRTIKSRLLRTFIMANIDENYEFDANANTTCAECEKSKSVTYDRDIFRQCEKCAEIDALKLMDGIEFFVLACRHQRAGTLQILQRSSIKTKFKDRLEEEEEEEEEKNNERENYRYIVDSRTSSSSISTSGSDDDDYKDDDGNTVIPIKGDTLSSTTRKQRTHKNAQRRQRPKKQEGDAEECCVQ